MNSRPKNSKFHRQTQRILDKRPSQVVPVGAWVELCPRNDNEVATVAAQYEEERLQTLQAEKEAKLARFRKEVRSRVRELQCIKKQKQLQESFQAVNLQGRVVHRTAPSASILSHRKDTCIYQSSDPHAIGHTAHQPTPEAWGREGQGDVVIRQQVRQQAGLTRRLVQKAKHDLAAKQLVVKPKMDKHSVPGGVWGETYSRDKPTATINESPVDPSSDVIDLEMTSSTHSQRIPQEPIEGALYDESGDWNLNMSGETQDSDVPRSKHVTFAVGGQRSPQGAGMVKGHLHGHGDHTDALHRGSDSEKYFTDEQEYELSSGHGNIGNNVNGHIASCDRVKGHAVPEVNPGVVAVEQRRQHGMQFSMYRRLYMDIEREQVKENLRKKTHQKKMQELKKTKEQERLEVEHQSQLTTQPILRESEAETRQREQEEAEEIHRIQTRLRQKNKETRRFIQALRAMMKERIKLLGINPPPLCACGPSVWDANPDTCANNCIFYKNPKAYAKALASVLNLNETG